MDKKLQQMRDALAKEKEVHANTKDMLEIKERQLTRIC
jgi:hypothetical protein